MMIRLMMACWLCLACASTLAQTATSAIESDGARIEVLGQNYPGGVSIGPGQTRIVLYRLDDDRRNGATSIFVNGSYHASLIKGAYTDLCYAPGSVELGARQAQVGQSPRDLPDTITAMRLLGGQTHYLRVREQGGRPVLFPVSAQQALQELPSKRLQLHTISRVAQDCIEVTPEPVAAQPDRRILAADTLFAFARSDRNAMTSAGAGAIDSLLAKLHQDYARIDRLHVIGYADPLGDPAINERLSIERANTVRQYIESTGRQRMPITAEGRGSREPVVGGCGSVPTPQAQACNQPNRRVVIEVTGLRH